METEKTMAEKLNQHLADGGTVIVATYCKAWEYKRKHAGWFSMSSKGNLMVQHGRRKDTLSIGERLLVSVRLYG